MVVVCLLAAIVKIKCCLVSSVHKVAYNSLIADTKLFAMNTITVTYKLKWRIKGKEYYQWSVCGKLFNTQRGNEIKKTVKGLTPGYWIAGEFISLYDLRERLELIPKKEYCPF